MLSGLLRKKPSFSIVVLLSGAVVSESTIFHLNTCTYTVEPLYNGQIGAGAFVRCSEVSFIGRFHHNNVYLTPYMVKDC